MNEDHARAVDREMMLTYSFDGGTTQKEKMGIVAQLWADEKEGLLNEDHARAIDREGREEAAKRQRAIRSQGRKGKIPVGGESGYTC